MQQWGKIKKEKAFVAKNINIICGLLGIVSAICRTLFYDNSDLLSNLSEGVVVYLIADYIFLSIFGCFNLKKNKFTFRLRCIITCVLGVVELFSIALVIFGIDPDWRICIPYLLAFLFSMLVSYNGYQAEKNNK